MIIIRPLTDKEFENFKKYVKCQWLDCAHGMGLAGQGICSHPGGKWNRKKCPEFIPEDDFLAQWEATAKQTGEKAYRGEKQEEYRKMVLKGNDKINIKLVEDQEKLEKQLEKFGVKIKPQYGLEPPLNVPFTPPAERLELALRVKARRLGQPLEWMRSVWLHGEAGQGFLREYQAIQ